MAKASKLQVFKMLSPSGKNPSHKAKDLHRTPFKNTVPSHFKDQHLLDACLLAVLQKMWVCQIQQGLQFN